MILKGHRIFTIMRGEIHPERTAIKRRTFSSPVKWVYRNWFGSNIKLSILDFGCGKGDDARLLKDYGYSKTEGYDPFNPEFDKLPNHLFDWVFLTYVLNVLPTYEERQEVCRKASSFVKKEGHLVITVRALNEIEKNRKPSWIPYNDGWITPKKTFQKGYERSDLYHDIDPWLKHWNNYKDWRGIENQNISLLLTNPGKNV